MNVITQDSSPPASPFSSSPPIEVDNCFHASSTPKKKNINDILRWNSSASKTISRKCRNRRSFTSSVKSHYRVTKGHVVKVRSHTRSLSSPPRCDSRPSSPRHSQTQHQLKADAKLARSLHIKEIHQFFHPKHS